MAEEEAVKVASFDGKVYKHFYTQGTEEWQSQRVKPVQTYTFTKKKRFR